MAGWLIERIQAGAIPADTANTMVNTHSPSELGKLIAALIRRRPHESVPAAVLTAAAFLPGFRGITTPVRGFMYHFAVAYWKQMSPHRPDSTED